MGNTIKKKIAAATTIVNQIINKRKKGGKNGQLKTLGNQMDYPVGIPIWVVFKINDQTISTDFGWPKTFQLNHGHNIFETF